MYIAPLCKLYALGWSDFALVWIYKIGHIAIDQRYFWKFIATKPAIFAERMRGEVYTLKKSRALKI